MSCESGEVWRKLQAADMEIPSASPQGDVPRDDKLMDYRLRGN